MCQTAQTYLLGIDSYMRSGVGVRAGMRTVDELKEYRWSSYWYLQHPAKRPEFMDLSGCLENAGGLSDTSAGRKKYREYLSWLAADTAEQKELLFDRMCRDWEQGI